VEVDDARLFFPKDRPDSLAEPMLRFWNELKQLGVINSLIGESDETLLLLDST